MSGNGYAYTTISTGRDEAARISVSFHLDDRARIVLYDDAERERTFLDVSMDDVSVTIGVADPGGNVTADDARIARHLADKIAAYAAAVERRAAAAEDGPAAA